MRSFIKIYGPPVSRAIRALERIAVDMPDVCIMSSFIVKDIGPHIARDIGLMPAESVRSYFASSGIPVSMERCNSIISRSGELLGEHDFFFEWVKEPTVSELYELIEKVDEALAELGCLYTITTEK
ncbi:hypothetical protein AC482_04535 [miscellaneous Crenarchaeota group-15 archaeon DG-45]|uniref:Uncharacterized protein n=1 Tax=miscellaneous Crenarchaeota group-15 archaeon DG-45 TaxID=1685127 RepID=A0A0M0BNM8_9ARCH|nr:MAG: hypothetical protein AC482_04535 [miscellaneous Crenarchaeota group-15 archaeon DG-45]